MKKGGPGVPGGFSLGRPGGSGSLHQGSQEGHSQGATAQESQRTHHQGSEGAAPGDAVWLPLGGSHPYGNSFQGCKKSLCWKPTRSATWTVYGKDLFWGLWGRHELNEVNLIIRTRTRWVFLWRSICQRPNLNINSLDPTLLHPAIGDPVIECWDHHPSISQALDWPVIIHLLLVIALVWEATTHGYPWGRGSGSEDCFLYLRWQL